MAKSPLLRTTDVNSGREISSGVIYIRLCLIHFFNGDPDFMQAFRNRKTYNSLFDLS